MFRKCKECKQEQQINAEQLRLLAGEEPRLPQSIYMWICPHCRVVNLATYSSFSDDIKSKLQ